MEKFIQQRCLPQISIKISENIFINIDEKLLQISDNFEFKCLY